MFAASKDALSGARLNTSRQESKVCISAIRAVLLVVKFENERKVVLQVPLLEVDERTSVYSCLDRWRAYGSSRTGILSSK